MPRCAPSWKSAARRQSKENAVSVAAAVNERDGCRKRLLKPDPYLSAPESKTEQ